MRIVFVEMLGKGGLIQYDYHLCSGLSRQGADVSLVTSSQYELDDLPHEFTVIKMLHMWDPRIAAPRNPLARLFRRSFRGLRYIIQWLRLFRFLLNNRPDVVFLSEIRFGFELYLIRLLKRSGFRIADIVHDVRPYDTSRNQDIVIQQETSSRYNKIYQCFDALFVHGKYSYDTFLDIHEVDPRRVHQIVLGTNQIVLDTPVSCTCSEMKKRLGIPAKKNLLLFFGTLNKYKGLQDLVEAFTLIAKDHDAHLLIAGFPAKDFDLNGLQQLVEERDLSRQVSWYLDYVPNHEVKPIFELANMVILPYREITQSAVLQLAYSCGRPVVATSVGGLPDVVENKETGLLVPPGDLQALAGAMTWLLANPEKCRKMGDRARQLSRTRYSWDQIAQKVLDVLESS